MSTIRSNHCAGETDDIQGDADDEEQLRMLQQLAGGRWDINCKSQSCSAEESNEDHLFNLFSGLGTPTAHLDYVIAGHQIDSFSSSSLLWWYNNDDGRLTASGELRS